MNCDVWHRSRNKFLSVVGFFIFFNHHLSLFYFFFCFFFCLNVKWFILDFNFSSHPAEMGVGLAVVTLFIALMQGQYFPNCTLAAISKSGSIRIGFFLICQSAQSFLLSVGEKSIKK